MTSPGSVLVTRTPAQAAALVAALASRGLATLPIPTIEIRPVEAGGDLDEAVRDAATIGGWIAVTSPNGATAVLDAAERVGSAATGLPPIRWAAVGGATRAALEARGVSVAFTPSVATATTLAAELPITPGEAVLLPRTDIANGQLIEALEARGARVTSVVAYRTESSPPASRDRLRAAVAAGEVAAIVFTSGSTVRGLLGLLGAAHRDRVRAITACCIGQSTASVARDAGFRHIVVAPAPDPAAIAALVHETLTTPPHVPPLSYPAPEPRQEDPA